MLCHHDCSIDNKMTLSIDFFVVVYSISFLPTLILCDNCNPLSSGQPFASWEDMKRTDILPFRTIAASTELECLQICLGLSGCEALNVNFLGKESFICGFFLQKSDQRSTDLLEMESSVYYERQELEVSRLILLIRYFQILACVSKIKKSLNIKKSIYLVEEYLV